MMLDGDVRARRINNNEWHSFIITIVSCTNTIVATSNLNFMLSVCMGVYITPSKFRTDCMYESRDTKLQTSHFPNVKGQGLPLHIENVWEKHDI